MAKFDFLPDLHLVYRKVAFFASYEQLQSQIFKNWTFRPHLVPPKGSNRGWYGIYGSSVGYHASNTSPSSKRGKILKISLGIFIFLEISHTCKKSCLWHNLQSIWNGVPLRHTHGENRYSEGMGLIGLTTIEKTRPICNISALWLNLQPILSGVLQRHTHGENRYSKSMGLIGLRAM